METAAIRRAFLEYFQSHRHEIVPSSSLVPANDPTLLFTNAGMVQFKDVFLGVEQRPYRRAVTAQRCVRAGGKHNDLENVGYTARHHTFFEMLGNFSFGDYFKREAIDYAWQLLTEGFRLPPDRLWITVFEDDDEAADSWLNGVGVDPQRFSRIGAHDNFWAMGDTGPCGPCSEIFYDHGADIPGGPPGSADADTDRYVEIWNLVFMQFNRNADGELIPLPKPSVDTGMGLERLATVLQGVHSNYETDQFQRLIAAAAIALSMPSTANQSLQVIADHIRSTSFLIADGVMPSNEGRGYVLRRIIRRAIRHGYGLGATRPFFHRLVAPLVEEMGDAYPELRDAQQAIERTLKIEGEKFAETLEIGIKLLEREIAQLSGTQIPGDVAFKLYDTYGFPVDLTADVAREHDLSVDVDGFEQAMQQQRTRARAASQFGATEKPRIEIDGVTEFTGYSGTQNAAKIVALHKDNGLVTTVDAGEQVLIVLDTTPFYPQGGGQVGDRGRIVGLHGEFEVTDTQRFGSDVIGHIGVVRSGRMGVTESVDAEVDTQARATTANNHSATHLVHAALKQVLGAHVEQKGSLVAPDRLRFDFSHHAPVDREQLLAVEALVNAQIRTNHAVETTIMEIEAAKAAGAEALFGEKYDSEVRVVSMGDYSLELCGGTHVARTGDIGLFRIASETGIAAGVRRIEALTGAAALRSVAAQSDLLDQLGGLLKAGSDELLGKAKQLVDRNRELQKELQAAQVELASGGAQNVDDQVQAVDDVKVLVTRRDGVETKSLRAMLDRMRQQLGSGVVVVGSARDGKVSIIAGVSADLTDRLHAGRLVQSLAAQVGGKGGGKAEMGQGGGADSEALGGALDAVYSLVASQLAGD